MFKLDNREEISLLLYLETCAVDHFGFVDSRRMNIADFDIAEKWAEGGFIKFGRVRYKEIRNHNTNWCVLSDEAFDLAHKERRARARRNEQQSIKVSCKNE